jgi:DNA-binding NarL/FixJ family response regulator
MPRLLIADTSGTARDQLKSLIHNQPGWIVCGETGNGLKAVLLANELKPDLVILDLVLSTLDGLNAAAEIAKVLPSVPILIYSRDVPPQLDVNAREFGVWAAVSKSADQKQLIETVERLLQGCANAESEIKPNSSTATNASSEPQSELPPDPPPDLD